MTTSRPKLTLDEQSFQDMLAAAFTIQEHNTRRRKEARSSAATCGKCGVPVSGDGPFCHRCGIEPRPGESLQRKWASMWLMSQEQGVWPDRRPGETEAVADPEPASTEISHHQTATPAELPVLSDLFEPREFEGLEKKEEDLSTKPNASALKYLEHFLQPVSAGQALRILPDATIVDSDLGFHETDSNSDQELVLDVGSDLEVAESRAPLSLRDLRLKLRFHRADFYLVIAVAIAIFAMAWVLLSTPAPEVNHKPHLQLWERALIGMGLAEAPEAPVRRGNPTVPVWVDPKTALYYCAGEELYGKGLAGHVATQREAQLDQFEPAGRVPCE
jgi:hypothetical protein